MENLSRADLPDIWKIAPDKVCRFPSCTRVPGGKNGGIVNPGSTLVEVFWILLEVGAPLVEVALRAINLFWESKFCS